MARLGFLAWTTVLALLVQFLLGVANNLFTVIQPHHPWTSSSPLGLLWAHVVVGVALLGNAVMVLRRTSGMANGRLVGAAVTGLAGVLAADIAGVLFVVDSQTNAASMVMSAGFAVAVAAYASLGLVGHQRAAGDS